MDIYQEPLQPTIDRSLNLSALLSSNGEQKLTPETLLWITAMVPWNVHDPGMAAEL